RVAVVGGRVQYLKNGGVVLESRQAPRYPLMMAEAIGTLGATVRNARIETNARAFTNNNYGYQNRYPDQYGAVPSQYSNAAYDEFARLDRNRDGVVNLREWQGTRREFDLIDTNRDGVLSPSEFAQYYNQSGYTNSVVGTSGEEVIVDPTQPWTDTGV